MPRLPRSCRRDQRLQAALRKKDVDLTAALVAASAEDAAPMDCAASGRGRDEWMQRASDAEGTGSALRLRGRGTQAEIERLQAVLRRDVIKFLSKDFVEATQLSLIVRLLSKSVRCRQAEIERLEVVLRTEAEMAERSRIRAEAAERHRSLPESGPRSSA